MNPLKIGILSDTHLARPTETFKKIVAACFHDTEMILHAGDLTDPAILTVFSGKEVHAVHGNMCSALACQHLPTHKQIQVGGFTIGLIHRAGNTYDFEQHLIEIFPEADCIVYGHTHRPVCHRLGGVLYLNPVSPVPAKQGQAAPLLFLRSAKPCKAGFIKSRPRVAAR